MGNKIVSASGERPEKFISFIAVGTARSSDPCEDTAKTQLGLSARHALATRSASVKVVDISGILVSLNGWLYQINPEKDLKKLQLVLSPQDVHMDNPDNYEKYDNYYIEKLVFIDKETAEMYEVYEESGIHFYLSKQLYAALREKKFFSMDPEEQLAISLKGMTLDQPFVFLRISNQELTQPIKQLTAFIQKGKKPSQEIGDYSEYVKVLNELFHQGGMAIPSVHIEMIIRNLIRDVTDELSLPDWSVKQTPDMYTMKSMNDAAILSKSVIAGLMFEKVKYQFKSPITYKKRETSAHSLLFVNE